MLLIRSRRQFLQAAAASATLFASSRSWPAQGATRSITFVHTHTGEHLSSEYFQNGAYVPSELDRVNHLLRDFRTGEVHPIDPIVLDILADLRVLANSDQAFEVISAYRSPQTNALLRSRSSGVAEHSLHMQGRAIDVRLRGVATVRLRDLALSMQRGGVGYYARSDFVHVDSGRIRHW